ncbi:MAG: FGGY-family carbohydrate kinase [bacterium]
MKKDLIVGVDCSTTAAKAIVWDKEGNLISEGREAITLINPGTDWAEQKTDHWWDSTSASLRKCLQDINLSRISALGITHQRETFVPINQEGVALRNAIGWWDSRAVPQVDRLRELAAEKIHRITGKPPNIYASSPKILWIRENEPGVFRKVYKYLDVHGYLAWRLTGRFATAWPSADPLGIFDIRKLEWSSEIIDLLGLKIDQLPELCAPGEIVGWVTKKAANETHLPEGLPVVGGGGDGQCAALGVHIIQPGAASLNLGTAVVSELFSQEYRVGKAFRTMCGCVPKTYILESVLAGGTYTIDWFIKEFGCPENMMTELSYLSPREVLELEASKIKPGSVGLITIPYWKGAGAPYWDPRARGVILGWRGFHGKGHLYRSILEGITLEQRIFYEEIEKALGSKIKEIRLLGGGARSSLWGQIVADITGVSVLIPQSQEATCLGAAMLAAYGGGLYSSIPEASKNMFKIRRRYSPQKENFDFYSKLFYRVYKPLYPRVQKIITSLTRLVEPNG